MAQALFNSITLSQNFLEIITQLMARDEINPVHPVMPTMRRYEVVQYEYPVCEVGKGYIVVRPAGQAAGGMITTCLRRATVSARIDVIQDTKNNQGFTDFLGVVGKVSALFSEGGERYLFETGTLTATLPEGEVSVSAPFTLGGVGVHGLEISGRAEPRKIAGNGCKPWMSSILVTATVHF